MTCKQTERLLNAYVDGELDSASSLAIESHAEVCPACSNGIASLRSLASAIGTGALQFKAPPRLKAGVEAKIRAAQPRVRNSFFAWRWATVAIVLLIVAALGWIVMLRRGGSIEQAQLVSEIISSHVRSTMANHITDVSSTDSHTVKPWFSGKLDYSPPVKDLTEQGYRLIGGRLDYVKNRPVAALVYQHRQHLINLFIWPAGDSSLTREKALTIQGYNVIHWNNSGMTYWLVSELNQAELNECARLLTE